MNGFTFFTLVRWQSKLESFGVDLKEFYQEVKEVLGSLNYPTKSLLI